MKFSFAGMGFFPWHSINLLPHFSCVGICEDDYPYKRDGSLLEMVLFGYVIHIHVPFNLPNVSTGAYGPLWSKTKKKWYRAPK